MATTAVFLGSAIVFVGGMFALRFAALGSAEQARSLSFVAHAAVISFAAGYIALTAKLLPWMRRLRTAERVRHPELFQAPQDRPGARARELKSRARLLGVPLVHIRFALPEAGDPPAIGWIAAGDVAFGLLFAWGGFAVAPISVGIVSLGVLTVGAVGFGMYAMGTIGIGVIAMGACAIGYQAYGSLSALGWKSAVGSSFSTAREAALGPIADAQHVNDETAAELANLSAVGDAFVPVLAATAALAIVPVVLYARAVRKRMRVAPHPD